MTTADSSTSVLRCACGHDRTHHMVSADADHGFLGWTILFVGVSHTPSRVRFHCRVCDQVFDESDDPEEMKKYATY